MRNKKYPIRNLQGALLWMLLWLIQQQLVYAGQVERNLGVGLLHFNYKEYDDKGAFLDGESGLLPGVLVSLKNNKPRSFYQLEASLYSSEIEYDGQTQTHIPLKTTSLATIFDGHFKLAMQMERHDYLYAGAGFRYWYRNIYPGRAQNGSKVAGVQETYSWPYLLLGYQARLYQEGKAEVGLDIRVTQMLSARMNIDFLGYCGYDNTHFNLGNRNGWRFAVPIKIKSSSISTFFIKPYYEIIDIGKSNTVSLTRNGALVDCNSDGNYDGAYEPRSETRNLGVELTWLW